MPTSIGVDAQDDRAVVVKRASGEASVECLRREGERLRRARHPGVVAVVRSAPAADGWELVMAHGGRSLATFRGAPPAQLAGIVAGVASTLADLHEIGITHGRVDASHVLVNDRGGPLLCGFGADAGRGAPEDDVAQLGSLLAELVGTDEEPEPIPERRWRRPQGWRGWERRALLLLADQATSEEPSRRPTARRFAAALAEAVPTPAAVGPPPDGEPTADDPMAHLRPADDTRNRTARRPAGVGLLAVGCLVLLVGALGALGGRDGQASPSPGDRSAAPRVAEPVTGEVLVADGKRYRVGQAGDHLLVGDWSCEGAQTPAAFRPSTREVFVFDRWADGEELTTRAVTMVPNGVSMESTPGADGCPSLSVRTTGGDLVSVNLGGLR